MTKPPPRNEDHSLVSRRGFLAGTAAVAATVGLSGCGGASGDSLSAAGKPVKGGPTTKPNREVPYPKDYLGPIASFKGPVTTEPARLKVVVPQNPTVGDWNGNAFSSWYEKRTNVHVDYEVVPGDPDTMTKVNAMLASGELPDIFMVPFTPSQLLLFGRDQQLFISLDDLIDKYGVEVKRVFKDYPVAKQLVTAPDDKIYSLPNVNDCFHCHAGDDRAWIYKPWLDKLGLPVPTSLDELEQVLEAFKSEDLNGNGKNDEIPFATDKDASLDRFFMGSFMYDPGEPWLTLNDGTVEAAFTQPGWREGLRYMNRLYGKGLIAKETFTQTNEQLQRLGNSDPVILGATRSYYWGSFISLDQNNGHARFRDYVAIPTLKGPGDAPTAAWDYYGAVATAGHFVITRACKVPEIAMMWGDGQYELEAIIRSYAGIKDDNWRWAKPGERGINGEQGLYKSLKGWPAKPGRSWDQEGIQYRSDNFRLGEVVDPKNPTFESDLYKQTKSAYEPFRQPMNRQLPPLYMNFDEAGAVADMSTTINNYVKQMLTKFTTGSADPNDDGKWKSYLDTLGQMGIDEYLKINQKAYDNRPH